MLQAKKLLRIQEEEGFINDQLEDTENNQEEEEIYPTQVTRVTSQEANQHVQNEITGGDPLSQNLEDEYVNVNMLQDLKSRFEQNFNAMKKEVHRMSLALRDYLNSFNKTTATDIRREIFKS